MHDIEIENGATCAKCRKGEMNAVQYGFRCEANGDGSEYRAMLSIIYHCTKCSQVDTDVNHSEWLSLVDALKVIQRWQIQLGI